MKGYIHIFQIAIIAIIFLVNLGCEPDVIIKNIPTYRECNAQPAPLYLPGDMIYGRVSGLKNCLPFVASASAYISHDSSYLMGLAINTYENLGGIYADKEILGIGAKVYAPGVWPLIKDSIPHVSFQYYRTVQDFDVLEDIFRIDTTYSFNRMAINSIDLINKEITGWFECRFIIRNPQNASGKNPDTIIFNDCHFIAKEK